MGCRGSVAVAAINRALRDSERRDAIRSPTGVADSVAGQASAPFGEGDADVRGMTEEEVRIYELSLGPEGESVASRRTEVAAVATLAGEDEDERNPTLRRGSVNGDSVVRFRSDFCAEQSVYDESEVDDRSAASLTPRSMQVQWLAAPTKP